MSKDYTIWKVFAGYLLILILMLVSSTASGQSPCGNDGLCVVQFNAGFNEGNKVTWLKKLNECETTFIDIGTDTKAAAKYKIVVIPTILIFNGEEEVARFQANIMMQMEAKIEDIQTEIDAIIMDAF
tara:strand:- start:983 stop:1363 length:381 start_codon:yes stop_codon:yes gene_type:complete